MLSLSNLDVEAVAKGGTCLCGGLFVVLLARDILAGKKAEKAAAEQAALEEFIEKVVDPTVNALDPDAEDAQ